MAYIYLSSCSLLRRSARDSSLGDVLIVMEDGEDEGEEEGGFVGFDGGVVGFLLER